MYHKHIHKHILIPFKDEFHQLILDGKKIMTTRSKKYGKPGDYFTLKGVNFTLLSVFPLKLKYIKECLYSPEGASSPEEFEEIWTQIHPVRGYEPEVHKYLHVFCKREDCV